MSPARTWRVLLLAWLPLIVLYPVAVVMMVGEERLPRTLLHSLATIGVAAGLGYAAWWLAGRIKWPDRPRPDFYLVHLALGLTYGVGWFVGSGALIAVIEGGNPWSGVTYAVGSEYLGWNVLFGFLVYGLVVSMGYALRARAAIREQRLHAARVEARAARAQLAALQAQLNPHFLFNTLHSLSQLVRVNADAAEEALNRLGHLMRYALDRSGSEEVLLRDELEFVDDYLAIEQLRLGERLTVTRAVDSWTLDAAIPPFSVQPLVENAVRHGIGSRTEGGTITISAAVECGKLVLEVADDGVGTTPDAIRQSQGFGLRAVRQRLQGHERHRGTLLIDTKPGAGFVARLEFAHELGGAGAPNAQPLTVS